MLALDTTHTGGRLHWRAGLGDAAAHAQSVVVFGSRAVGAAEAGSDLDVLCVGSGPRVKSASLDVLWVSAAQLDRHWLGSELAAHIGAYGVCVRGHASWMSDTFVSRCAVERKTRMVRSQAAAFERFAPELSAVRAESYAACIRRDLQRLMMMESGRAVVVRTELERRWRDQDERSAASSLLTEVCGRRCKRLADAIAQNGLHSHPEG